MGISEQQHETALNRLQKKIAYTFRQPELLKRAVTHRSFSAQNNERLEFIGDAVLNYSVAKMLFDAYSKEDEGRLSRFRANLVNQETLAEVARELSLGDALLLGPGELNSGGFDRPSILSDALEALFAAVSLDADFLRAEKMIREIFAARVRAIDLDAPAKDAKSRLQEFLQGKRLPLPKYRLLKTDRQDKEGAFEVECDLGELGIITRAGGHTRRASEQVAAQKALTQLQKKFP